MENNINYAALSLDEIIFIDRNKAYGAYELRQSYNQNVKRAILGTIFFTTFAMAVEKLYASHHPVLQKDKVTVITHLSDAIEIVTPPPPPAPKPKLEQQKLGSTEAATSTAAEMKPTEDKAVLTDTIATPDPDIDIDVRAHAGKAGETLGVKTGTAPEETHKSDAPAAESAPLSWAEKMPEFPGGEKALLSYISDHLKYPEYDMETGVHGKVLVGFVVDENGKVGSVHVIRGVSKGIDRESMRVISSLPTFSPGMQSGRKVKVSFVIPLDFHQKEE
jgi:protein TonB